MDPITLLAEQRALVERLRKEASDAQRRLDVALAEERAMLRLWEVVSGNPVDSSGMAGVVQGVATVPDNAPQKRRGGGRRPGAITRHWQHVLAHLYGRGPVPYSVIADEVGRVTGRQIESGSVRDRVRSMIKMGFISGNPSSGFQVTEAAAEKFGFRNDETPDAATPGASTSDGPEAELEGSLAAQHPAANRESVGSNPTRSAPFRRELLSGT